MIPGDTTSAASTGARQRFDVCGRLIESTANAAEQAILADAYAERIRPVCQCRTDGAQMYIARLGRERFIVKRMPDTGLLHAPDCPSFSPPQSPFGPGRVVDGPVHKQPDTGITTLRLGFRLARADNAVSTRRAARVGHSGPGGETAGTGLSLRALLHYLWQEAGLAAWSPAMAGKRNWRVVSWYLRQAAEGKFVKGKPLCQRLFVPEPFTAERKVEMAARRLAAWAPARASGHASQFMILIGEMKAVQRARWGHKLVIKHLPDAPLMLDEEIHRRMLHRFAGELDMWEADEQGHLMAIMTFSVGGAGLASVREMSLAMTDEHWLPYETATDKMLLDAVIAARRRFTKCLRYDLPAGQQTTSLVLTDTKPPTGTRVVPSENEHSEVGNPHPDAELATWTWTPGESMPPLPTARPRRHDSS